VTATPVGLRLFPCPLRKLVLLPRLLLTTLFHASVFPSPSTLIKDAFSTPLHPQSNGLIERFNCTLGTMLTMYCHSNQREWDLCLQQVLMANISSLNCSTGQTPNKIVFGRDIILPMQACIGPPPTSDVDSDVSPESYVCDLQQQLESIHDIASEVIKTKAVYRKRQYDLYSKKRNFSIGDAVWLFEKVSKPGVCSKLSFHWKGPCLVTKKIDDLVYVVKRSSKQPAKPIHIDRLMKYNSPSTPNGLLMSSYSKLINSNVSTHHLDKTTTIFLKHEVLIQLASLRRRLGIETMA